MLRARGRRFAVGGLVLICLALAFPWAAAAAGERAAGRCACSAPVAGKRATLLAAGFRPHETVTAVLLPGNVAVGRTTAAGRGLARLTFTVPGRLSGSYRATLTGGASAATASCLLRVSAPPVERRRAAAPLSGAAMALVGLGAVGALLAVGGVSVVAVSRRTPRVSATDVSR